jgi:hypothetical protein
MPSAAAVIALVVEAIAKIVCVSIAAGLPTSRTP